MITKAKCIVKEWGTIAKAWEEDYPELPFVTVDVFHYWPEHLYDEKYGNCRRCGAGIKYETK